MSTWVVVGIGVLVGAIIVFGVFVEVTDEEAKRKRALKLLELELEMQLRRNQIREAKEKYGRADNE
jgi:uncharacterized membrane-anchored protein YhcB (DUF1043 family)